MGREIRRVPLDFAWPLHTPWKGFMNPYSSQKCKSCDGSGLAPEAKEVSDTWYTHNCPPGVKGWGHDITQDEVQALVDAGRLMDFTHDFVKGTGWVKKEPAIVPTAEEVNAWSRRGFGHDSINHWVCVKQRVKRLGLVLHCSFCEGEGHIWFSKKVEELDEKWFENERYGPPAGEGYQVWETVSEGSPISPPFATPEELADWMVANDTSTTAGTSKETWIKFIRDEAVSMSLVMDEKGIRDGVKAYGDT